MLGKIVSGAGVALLALVLLAGVLTATLHTAITASLPTAGSDTGATPASGTGAGTGSDLIATGTPSAAEAGPGMSAGASDVALAEIPPGYLRIYQDAAHTCAGLSWQVLAAIGKIESDHGRSPLPGVAPNTLNPATAGGPMQIITTTWEHILSRHRLPPGGASPPSRWNPHDSIHAAAFSLCDSGASTNLPGALFGYNHADWYVRQVLAQAARYTSPAPLPPTGGAGPNPATTNPGGPRHGTPPPAAAPPTFGGPPAPGSGGGVGARVVAFARAQIGQPYLWGGDGPAEGGFDCSGLTRAAYAAAGIALPRTAHTQYLAGPLLVPGTPVQAGDLVFFGTPAKVHHVAVATGYGSEIIHAPERGLTVRVGDWRSFPDALAVSRPGPDPAAPRPGT